MLTFTGLPSSGPITLMTTTAAGSMFLKTIVGFSSAVGSALRSTSKTWRSRVLSPSKYRVPKPSSVVVPVGARAAYVSDVVCRVLPNDSNGTSASGVPSPSWTVPPLVTIAADWSIPVVIPPPTFTDPPPSSPDPTST